MNKNRFFGLEDEKDVRFHREMIDRIAKHKVKLDRLHHAEKFDPLKEHRKVS